MPWLTDLIFFLMTQEGEIISGIFRHFILFFFFEEPTIWKHGDGIFHLIFMLLSEVHFIILILQMSKLKFRELTWLKTDEQWGWDSTLGFLILIQFFFLILESMFSVSLVSTMSHRVIISFYFYVFLTWRAENEKLQNIWEFTLREHWLFLSNWML